MNANVGAAEFAAAGGGLFVLPAGIFCAGAKTPSQFDAGAEFVAASFPTPAAPPEPGAYAAFLPPHALLAPHHAAPPPPLLMPPDPHQDPHHASTSRPPDPIPAMEPPSYCAARKCRACNYDIDERFLLQVGGDYWHERCLRCACCDRELAGAPTPDVRAPTCYVRDDRVYCRQDHQRLFAAKCSTCAEPLKPTDFVYRCGERRFHAQCFQCAQCSQPLKTGDQYVCLEGRIICHRDYNLLYLCTNIPSDAPSMAIQPNDLAMAGNGQMAVSLFELSRLRSQGLYQHHHNHSGGGSKRIPKRPRTILNAHQRKAFKYAFEHGSKPSRKLREQLAKDTGLSVRVVQVWFQNQRAKIKKEQRKRETDKPSSSASLTMSTDSDGKSAAEDDVKSPLCSGTESDIEDFDLEEVLSGRSSVSQSQSHFGADSRVESQPNDESANAKSSDAIDKLYRMHHTYFAFV